MHRPTQLINFAVFQINRFVTDRAKKGIRFRHGAPPCRYRKGKLGTVWTRYFSIAMEIYAGRITMRPILHWAYDKAMKKPSATSGARDHLKIFYAKRGGIMRGECDLCGQKFYTSMNPATDEQQIREQQQEHLRKKHAPNEI
jgi:hypothetical protein